MRACVRVSMEACTRVHYISESIRVIYPRHLSQPSICVSPSHLSESTRVDHPSLFVICIRVYCVIYPRLSESSIRVSARGQGHPWDGHADARGGDPVRVIYPSHLSVSSIRVIYPCHISESSRCPSHLSKSFIRVIHPSHPSESSIRLSPCPRLSISESVPPSHCAHAQVRPGDADADARGGDA